MLTRALFIVSLLTASIAGAQQVETPVPFDSSGQVMVITSAAASRMRLGAPGWPVTGDFTEARVFITGENSFVLVVERPGGARERRPLTGAQYEALRAEVSAGARGRAAQRPAATPVTPANPAAPPPVTPRVERSPSAPVDDPGFESARGRFTRNMVIAAAGIYGPAAWAIVDEPAGGFAAYLGVVGASFFGSYAATQQGVTRAQAELASDFAIRGAGAGLLFAHTIDPDPDTRPIASSIFLIGAASTVAGYHLGKGMSLAEVSAMSFGSTALGLTAFGTMAALGSAGGEDFSRNDAGAILIGGIVGLPAGLFYQRSAPYTVTAGDVTTLGVGGGLGALTAATIVSRFHDPSEEGAAAVMTAGFLAGLAAGDLLWARRFDHTTSEGGLLWLGAAAGAAIGAAPFVIAGSDTDQDIRKWLVGATLGSYLGAWGTTVLSQPKTGTWRTAMLSTPERSLATRQDRPAFRIDPVNAALAAAKVKGTFPVLSLTF